MERNLSEEKAMRIESAMIGVELAFNKLGIRKAGVSQRKAYRLYGEAKVKSWVCQELITPTKKGPLNSIVTYSLIDLDVLKSLDYEQN